MRLSGVMASVAISSRTVQSPVRWMASVTGFGPRPCVANRNAIHSPGASTSTKVASFRGDKRPARSCQGYTTGLGRLRGPKIRAFAGDGAPACPHKPVRTGSGVLGAGDPVRRLAPGGAAALAEGELASVLERFRIQKRRQFRDALIRIRQVALHHDLWRRYTQ